MSGELDYLVVGAGIPGLLAANYLKTKNPTKSVTVVEVADQAGGLYRSEYLAEIDSWVDLGMHLYYETGIEEFDNFVRGSVNSSSLNVLSGNQKDVAGIFYNGRLQKLHPFPDFRDRRLAWRITQLLTLALRKSARSSGESRRSAEQFGRAHFGDALYGLAVEPVLRRLFKADPSELEEVVLTAPELRRVALFGPFVTRILSLIPRLKEKLAYPNQLEMPELRQVNQAGYYPKTIGFGPNFVEHIESSLREKGVSFSFRTQIQSISGESPGPIFVSLSRNGSEQSLTVRNLLWCAPIPPLAGLLRIGGPENLTSTSKKKYFLAALIQGENPISPLYYFYVYEKGSAVFRVTNYASYTSVPSAKPGTFLIGVEMWLDDNQSEVNLEELCRRELVTLGLAIGEEMVRGVWKLKARPPQFEPTLSSANWIYSAASKALEMLSPSRFAVAGPFTKPGLFYLQDVLRGFWADLRKLSTR